MMFARFRTVNGKLAFLYGLTAAFPMWFALPQAASADDVDQGFEIARRFCGRCHGEGSYQGSSKLSIIDPEGLVKEKYIVPGRSEESFLWQRVKNNEMPPDNQPQLSEDEKRLFKLWVESGGRKPKRVARGFRSELEIQSMLQSDLERLSPEVRRRTRYFSLTHLHNNSAVVSDFDLRYYRAALAKSINSLSWSRELVRPRPIDSEGTLLAIDLKDLGWAMRLWDALLERYPYGLRFDRSGDEELAKKAAKVHDLCGTVLPSIRADWFTTTATRPPLYHKLLSLPANDVELERQLGVRFRENFQQNRLQRAGFAESGVSISNRLVERHETQDGYYWKSYDFKRSNGTGNLFQFPLGPAFAENPFTDFAFQHDGGELIFSLPNGLQAYLLVDGKGSRIDSGPIEVVRDLKETSGTPLVVNGISCMHCHQNGMIGFRDAVRSGVAVFGDIRRKTLAIYPPQTELDRLVEKDQQRFLRALTETIGPWLISSDDQNSPSKLAESMKNLAEPIAIVTRFYNADVSLETAAFELGLKTEEELATAIKSNNALRKLGLGPLLNQQKIDRQVWENQELTISPMQHAARELDIASPFVLLPSE